MIPRRKPRDAGRTYLPTRRRSVTMRIRADTLSAHATIGFDASGQPAEIFLRPAASARVGSAVDALCDEAAISISLLLQYGVPPSRIRRSLGNAPSVPASLMGAAVDALLASEPLPPLPRAEDKP